MGDIKGFQQKKTFTKKAKFRDFFLLRKLFRENSLFIAKMNFVHSHINFASLFLFNNNSLIVNPIPAGVLKNQDTLRGGGQFDPPPLNPMFDVQI